MIIGTHIIFFSENTEADRAFLRDVLELKFMDAGHGWLIFALPPAEAAVHPTDGANQKSSPKEHSMAAADVYLMCDDLATEMTRLKAKNVEFSPVAVERWGKKTTFRLPSGGELGLYQPTHPTALNLK